MATGIFMPKLSMTMETGTIIQWFKQVGDDVKEGDLLLEVLTDKINIEVEAYATGKLLKIYNTADEVVPVNQIIGYIGAADEVVPDEPPGLEGTISQSDQAVSVTATAETDTQSADETENGTDKVRATPAARMAAKEQGLSLHAIKGTGPNGRIHKQDVLAHVAAEPDSVKATPLARKTAEGEGIPLDAVVGTGVQGKIRRADVLNALKAQRYSQAAAQADVTRVKLDGMRKVIAQRMAQSAFTAPHVTIVTEVDMSAAIELRASLLPVIEKKTGLRLSYTEIIMKAVAHALMQHPQVNASLEDDYIVYHPTANVGLAVAVPNGLVVPVVEAADQKGLAELADDCKRLAGLARDGKLLPDHMRGGTFTISNLGMYAIDAFTPIINQPESAILGVGRINEKPVGVQGQIELRPMMTLSLSFDHRIIDGAPAAEFLQAVKTVMENPYQLIV